MSYPLIPYLHGPRSSQPKPDQAVPASVAAMAADYDPPYGSHGEMLPMSPRTERPAPPQPLKIDPPEWADDLADGTFDLSTLDPPAAAPRIPPTVGDYDPPPPPGMPVQLEPLRYPSLPAPDWEQELAERDRLEAERRQQERRLIYEQELARISDEGQP